MTLKIKILISALLLVIVYSQNLCLAQRMGKKDFQIGVLGLKIPYDSIETHFGTPDSVKNFDEPWSEFTAHYYPKMVVWSNKNDHRIWAFDIYDSSLTTHRGVKIGDSVALIDKLYPTIDINIDQRRFSRVGPYDANFINYSETRLYDYMPSEEEGWVLILFTKDNILTKLLFYVGVPE